MIDPRTQDNIINTTDRKHKFLSLKTFKRVVLALVVVVIFEYSLSPAAAMASEPVADEPSAEIITVVEAADSEEAASNVFVATFPASEDLSVVRSGYYTVTAYNSEAGQTDSTPCITANGFNVCEHGIEDTVATNMLPFGSKVKMPDIYGDRVFVVRDRMNKRYPDRFDVWMLNKQDARQFGVKKIRIEVLEH